MKRDFELSRLAPMEAVTTVVACEHERPIGHILRDQCQLGDDDINRVLTVQTERGLRFGDAAVLLRLVEPADVQHALARQFGYACAAATDHPHMAELCVAVDPHGAKAELFRDLRAQIMLRPGGQNHGTTALAVVSPDVGDGRTHIAANLAVAFSQLGERTVLVDANLRTPRLHQLFNLPARPGLTSILADRRTTGELDCVDVLPCLHVLQVGAPPPNPLELLQRAPFGALMRELMRKFDRVIVDTPAACLGADARVIADCCRQALVLGRRNSSATRHLAALVSSLRQQGVDLPGVVINDH